MKIDLLFLDIDGVLNMYGTSYRSFVYDTNPIEKICIERLNFLCDKFPNLYIVISSAWRGDMKKVFDKLFINGFAFNDKIIGRTNQPQRKFPDSEPPYELINTKRGEQILSFIEDFQNGNLKDYLKTENFSKVENAKIRKYLVVDDDVWDLKGFLPKKHIIHVDGNEGILNKDIFKICNILTKKRLRGNTSEELYNNIVKLLTFNMDLFSGHPTEKMRRLINRFAVKFCWKILHLDHYVRRSKDISFDNIEYTNKKLMLYYKYFILEFVVENDKLKMVVNYHSRKT